MRYTYLLLVSLIVAGCSPTWFKDFKSDPVTQTNFVLDSATSIEQVAIVVFNQLKPLLPATKQPEFQAKFDGSIVALNKAMEAVRTAVKAAADAQQEHPDMSGVIAEVVKAVQQVKDVVTEVRDLLKSPPVGASTNGTTAAPMLGADPVGFQELSEFSTALGAH
jgi:hypothetical protein